MWGSCWEVHSSTWLTMPLVSFSRIMGREWAFISSSRHLTLKVSMLGFISLPLFRRLGTELESIWLNETIQQSKHLATHLSDALRLVYVYKVRQIRSKFCNSSSTLHSLEVGMRTWIMSSWDPWPECPTLWPPLARLKPPKPLTWPMPFFIYEKLEQYFLVKIQFIDALETSIAAQVFRSLQEEVYGQGQGRGWTICHVGCFQAILQPHRQESGDRQKWAQPLALFFCKMFFSRMLQLASEESRVLPSVQMVRTQGAVVEGVQAGIWHFGLLNKVEENLRELG